MHVDGDIIFVDCIDLLTKRMPFKKLFVIIDVNKFMKMQKILNITKKIFLHLFKKIYNNKFYSREFSNLI